MPELPAQLRRLSPDQLEELQDLAETKAWLRATTVGEFTEREQEALADAERRSSPRAVKKARHRLHNRHLWDSLRWWLFGGYVDLVGLQEEPLKAWDPETNPWLKFWVPGWVQTQDEHDAASPYKRLPDADYLRLMSYAWVHRPLLAVPKSRQMMVSWLFAAIMAHYLIARPAQRIAVISKKEGDADQLLKRVETICNGLPHGRFWVPSYKKTYAFFTSEDNNTHIHAMSEEAKALRSYTFSWIFSDEAAFQDQFKDIVQSALPTVHGGARFTLVSTSNGEEGFYDIVSEGGRIPCPPGP